ncbi:MAG: FAD-dependent oxidoreductase [Firmicutes bacterium]|nr:FAD-dependent oxidoreductase [Bacillota bacterium]
MSGLVNREFVRESARDIPVIANVDVAVLGGGPAGFNAAVAAARLGVSTIMIEKNGYMGGVATAGLVSIWHSLYSMDRKRKIIGGIVDDVLARLEERSAVYGQGDFYTESKGSFVVDTEAAKLVFDQLALEAGVKLLFHTYVVDVIGTMGEIQAVIVENKSGRGAIKAKIFIDCTGDGDVAYRAGASYEKGDLSGLMQPPGLCVRVGGLNPSAFKSFESGAVSKALDKEMDYNGQIYPSFLWYTKSGYRPDEIMMAAARMTNTDCSVGEQFSQASVDGRLQIDWIVRTLKNEVPGFEDAHIVDIAAEVGARETRRFLGDYVLTEEDLLTGRGFSDVIGHGTYPVDIHNPVGRGIIFKHLNGVVVTHDETGNVTTSMWTADGNKSDVQYYNMPYRVLLPRDMSNLMVAGRCVSMTHEALGAIRVMVNCMQLGQAAGVGAAISCLTQKIPRDVEVGSVQAELVNLGLEL